MAMKECVECGEMVSEDAKSCPHCGKKDPTETIGDKIGAFITVVIIFSGLMWWSPWSPNDKEEQKKHPVSNASEIQQENPVKEEQIDINKVIKLRVSNRINTYTNARMQVLNITSLQDNVILQDVIFNRGKCIGDDMPMKDMGNGRGKIVQLPIKLNFGEMVKFDDRCPSLIEIEIETNKGSGVWSF